MLEQCGCRWDRQSFQFWKNKILWDNCIYPWWLPPFSYHLRLFPAIKDANERPLSANSRRQFREHCTARSLSNADKSRRSIWFSETSSWVKFWKRKGSKFLESHKTHIFFPELMFWKPFVLSQSDRRQAKSLIEVWFLRGGEDISRGKKKEKKKLYTD